MSRIAEVRKANGYTQAKLAKHLGVGRSTVSMWESSSQEPDSETLGRIADLFDAGADVAYFPCLQLSAFNRPR